MLKRFMNRLGKQQRGFTLVEITATVLILSVVGLAVLNVTGQGQILLSRQSNEMDARISARAVLTRMAKDIEESKATNVTQDNKKIEILDENNAVIKTYGWDETNKQVYLKDKDGNTTYIIQAISLAIFSPPGKTNQVNMDITVSVGSSEMTFSASAMSRSVNSNSSGVPRIVMVAPNVVQFNGEEKIEHRDGLNHDDDDEDRNDDSGVSAGKQTIHISAVEAHFNWKTVVELVPKGGTLGAPANPRYKNVNELEKTVRIDANHLDIWFELKKEGLADSTYDVWAITPDTPRSGLYEKAFKLGALTVHLPGQAHAIDDPVVHPKNDEDNDTNKDTQKHSPNDDAWSDGSSGTLEDWIVDRGNMNGFGSINYSTKEIEKKDNSNDKVAYYNHMVADFDYQVKINITDQNTTDSGKLALLTLNYNGLNNTTGGGGWYIGFGINQNGVYYGEKGSLNKLTLPAGVSVNNGQAALRAVKYYDSTTQKYWLKLYVNGTQVFLTDKVPSGTGYLGVTVTENKMKAKFTVTRN